MNDYLLLMHDDVPAEGCDVPRDWSSYLTKLRGLNAFQGGSSIGGGECLSKIKAAPPLTAHLVGYIRVQAETLDAAKALVVGNPHFEAGGTVEVRELPVDDERG